MGHKIIWDRATGVIVELLPKGAHLPDYFSCHYGIGDLKDLKTKHKDLVLKQARREDLILWPLLYKAAWLHHPTPGNPVINSEFSVKQGYAMFWSLIGFRRMYEASKLFKYGPSLNGGNITPISWAKVAKRA